MSDTMSAVFVFVTFKLPVVFADLICYKQRPACNAPVPIYSERLRVAFVPPFQMAFLEGHGAFVCDQDQDCACGPHPRFGQLRLVGFRFFLDSGLHVADDTAARRPGQLRTRDVRL